jgi:hypothetical protein
MLSGIIPLFMHVITANRSAAYYSVAYKAADSIIEENRIKNFEDVDTYNGEVEGLPTGNSFTFTVNDEVKELDNEIKQVDLNIKWFFKSEKEINISTYITAGGIGR